MNTINLYVSIPYFPCLVTSNLKILTLPASNVGWLYNIENLRLIIGTPWPEIIVFKILNSRCMSYVSVKKKCTTFVVF